MFEEKPKWHRESVTIKRTPKGVWMRMYDDYETSFSRISEKEALESIENARDRGDLFSEQDGRGTGAISLWAYFN